MRVLFATAELAPIAAVGGLANAAAGLVDELRRQDVDVVLALPDYHRLHLDGEERFDLAVPHWAAPARVRKGIHERAGELHLVEVPGIERPHPYNRPDGEGWHDNDHRFLAFSAAVAALQREVHADVVHVNDWHTAAALASLDERTPTVLSIHNLAYQGTTVGDWLARIGPRGNAYEWWGACNPLKGGLVLADAIVAVSPNYAEEIRTPALGCGQDALLRWRGDALVGIRNGIDTTVWDPTGDRHLPRPFHADDLTGKADARAALAQRLGFQGDGPLGVLVTRLTHQKGTDLLPELVPFLRRLPLRLGILGAGDAHTAAELAEAAALHPDVLSFVEGYDDALSHLLHAGGDVLLMPSRFEPCGLSQMQAMRYGTLPVATDVGGLHDTIVDADERPAAGTGWLAARPELPHLVDALHRAVRGWRHAARRTAMQRRGMRADWSWHDPALRHIELYRRVIQRRTSLHE